jgi:hypothetical protein
MEKVLPPKGVRVLKQATPTMETPTPSNTTSTPPPPPSNDFSQMSNQSTMGMANYGGNEFADGGSVPQKGALANFFSGWNWLEIGLMTLGVAGVFYTINYYRYRVKSDKTDNVDIKRQLDEVKMNVQSAMKGKYQQI